MAGVLLLAAGAYLVAVRRVSRRGRHWPVSRTASFLAGILLLGVGLVGPVEAAAERRFSAHVTQHLLLSMGGPPLIALGAPVTLALQALARAPRRLLRRALDSPPAAVVTHPLVAWVAFVASLFVLYFSPLYRLSVAHPLVHEAVHVHFVAAGLVYFWPVVGLDPGRWRLQPGARMLSLALTIPFHAFLGIALMGSSPQRLVAGAGPAALEDQRLGGGIMWIAGDLVVLAVLGVVMAQWMASDERRAEREDAAVESLRMAGGSPPP